MSRFQEVAKEIGDLVTEKNAAYGDSFGQSGKILAILFPNGVPVEQYDDFLAITRIVDKLFRIANHKDAFQESPWRDICGYGLNAASRIVEDPSRVAKLVREQLTEQSKQYVIRVREHGGPLRYTEHPAHVKCGFNYMGITKFTATKFTEDEAKVVVARCIENYGLTFSFSIEEA